MNPIQSFTITLGMIALIDGITLACSRPAQTQTYHDSSLHISRANSPLTREEPSVALLKQGASRAMRGDYQGAIADYNEALRLNPKNPDVYYNLGVAHYNQGLAQQAFQDFNQAIQLDPEFAEAYGNRGTLRSQWGDKRGAIQDFQQAAKLFTQQGDKVSAQQMNEMIKQP
ncbi:MAG: hypothetical protein NVS2B14_13180 [Chamaesiphon sp.]